MNNIKRITEIKPLNYDIFIGLDVDKKSTVFTIMDHYNILEARKISSNPKVLINCINKKYSEKKIVFAYETGPTGWGLFDALTDAGYPCLVVPPNKIPDQKNRKVKTNRIDSNKIAKTLKGGELEGVRVPDQLFRELRHLTSLRRTLRKEISRCKNRIKSLILVEGLQFPPAPPGSWPLRVIFCLKQDPYYNRIRPKLNFLIESLNFNLQKLKESIKILRVFYRSNTDIYESLEYIKSLPGIGEISGIELISRIGDWRRLLNSKEIGSFLGLVPSENSTGETIRRGEITKEGAAHVRSLLIECSWKAIRVDPELKKTFQRIYRSNPLKYGSKKAIVAVARKLSARIYHVLKYRHYYKIKDFNELAA